MALELSPAFRARLVDQIADPRLIVPPAGAEQLAELLGRWRLPPPEVIVSGIPFSTLPADVADRVAAAVVRCLAPGGRFVAYQVRDHVVDLVAPHLGAPVAAWEWLNVPPLRVYQMGQGRRARQHLSDLRQRRYNDAMVRTRAFR